MGSIITRIFIDPRSIDFISVKTVIAPFYLVIVQPCFAAHGSEGGRGGVRGREWV